MKETLPEIIQSNQGEAIGNKLFPIFLKLEELKIIIIGGGNVGLEKLTALCKNAPATQITVLANKFSPELLHFAKNKSTILLITKSYENSDLNGFQIAISAVNDSTLSKQITDDAHDKGLLVNAADKPEYCDFYLSSIVTKGNLKIAISTNGKSPTVAKRLKEILTDTLPEEIDQTLENMSSIRQKLTGNLPQKIIQLNAITKTLIEGESKATTMGKSNWLSSLSLTKIIIFGSLLAIFFMVLGYAIISNLPPTWIANIQSYSDQLSKTNFYWMLLAGFLAQLVDGAMGMGYGVLSTTFLLQSGVSIAAVSSSVHMAEMFSVGAAGISHYKYKHVNKKLLLRLAIPGAIGAICGALFIGAFGNKYGKMLRPFISVYTMYLGIRIIQKAFKKRNKDKKKLTNVTPVALSGGFLDAFGGGWGPLVTSTLISGGRDPKYTIGTSTLTKFFTSICSTATFVFVLGEAHFNVIAGLIFGGLIAAPIAAKLSGKLNLKTMFICVGSLVILCSLKVIWSAIMK
ncbi:TSUP family transporter [Rhizosphaericola mali]|uniref:Probable membrane transporter protein n=1 Tax=Rhizosphaericola mali TaxID=2545455 RepID=A0A5P2G4T0_9BACT|nr:TSUP family transporter [Rhizosphaericola mali]QES90834.1 TSUP family transporter [Rhizosphaericola mali]